MKNLITWNSDGSKDPIRVQKYHTNKEFKKWCIQLLPSYSRKWSTECLNFKLEFILQVSVSSLGLCKLNGALYKILSPLEDKPL